MVTVKISPAEKAQNELAYCKGSWFDKSRFDIIQKACVEYYWRVKDGEYREPPRPDGK